MMINKGKPAFVRGDIVYVAQEYDLILRARFNRYTREGDCLLSSFDDYAIQVACPMARVYKTRRQAHLHSLALTGPFPVFKSTTKKPAIVEDYRLGYDLKPEGSIKTLKLFCEGAYEDSEGFYISEFELNNSANNFKNDYCSLEHITLKLDSGLGQPIQGFSFIRHGEEYFKILN